MSEQPLGRATLAHDVRATRSDSDTTVAGEPPSRDLLQIVVTMPVGAQAGLLVVRLVGELDLSNATSVGDQLGDLLAYRPDADVVLDLAGLSFMDCRGLAVVLEAHRVLDIGHRRLTMRGARPAVELLLLASGHEELLPAARPGTRAGE